VQYEIRVDGQLGPRWAAWFDGLTVTRDSDGTTLLRGSVVDQAALHGLLQKLRDVGIPLISLTPVEAPSTEAPTTQGPMPAQSGGSSGFALAARPDSPTQAAKGDEHGSS
jgi:hypothetical protein